jgi:hypothetical protein
MSIALPPPSPILAMAKRAADRKAAGHDVIDLTLGEPDFSPPEHVIAAAHSALDARSFPTLLQQGRTLGTGGSGGGGDGGSASRNWRVQVPDKLLKGRWGRAFIVLRDAEIPAKSLGVNEYRYKLLAFMLSAAVTGLAGALYTNYVGVITPNILGNEFFLVVMVMLCVGGLGRFPGVLIGAFVITLGNEYLRDFGQYRLIILGLAVILTLIALPNGLVDLPQRLKRRTHGEKSLALRQHSG